MIYPYDDNNSVDVNFIEEYMALHDFNPFLFQQREIEMFSRAYMQRARDMQGARTNDNLLLLLEDL